MIPSQLSEKGFRFVLLEKGGKRPFQKDWTNKIIDFDNSELIAHISSGGNYGVMGGGEKKLVIIDFDNEIVQNEALKKLKETFTVKTGRGLLHLYFLSDIVPDSFKAFDENLNTLFDVQGNGKQVVGPGSIHPNGTQYEVVKNIPIAEMPYGELKAILMPFDRKPKKVEKQIVLENEKPKALAGEDFIERVSRAVSIKEVLNDFGVDTSKNPTSCPFHASTGGKCLGFNNETAHCFHCDGSWNIFTLVKQEKNLDFKGALEYLARLARLETELDESRKEYFDKVNKINNTLPQIYLPGEGKLISSFATEIGNIIKEKKTLFFRPTSKDIIEVSNIKEDENSEEYVGFAAVSPERFITVGEKYFIPSYEVKDNTIYKSMNSALTRAVICSPQFQESLPKIKRIFNTPIPIIYHKELCFPKKGYDERFLSWTPYDSPEIDTTMDLGRAKDTLNFLYKEFCFQNPQDYINALSALLTPFLKGLYPSFNTRSPLYFYVANRERAGKDYCAHITGLVHEGNAIEEPPISNGEKMGSNNEELRKKILSAMIAGKKRMHFANNKGYINNAVFEGIITAEKYSDRALGKNEMITMDNEMDFSLSGNVGIGFTADIANRSRFIRLFLDIEDANTRDFENPNLHKWVKENRGLIISALYALVRNWFEKGMPSGSIRFSSFPEWAKTCGGIMEAAGYESPCVADKETLAVGGDEETKDMKILFEMCYETFGERRVKKQEIRDLIRNSGEPIFSYLDFSELSGQNKFGLKIAKFVGRILSDITLEVCDTSVRSARQEFKFKKVVKTPFSTENSGSVGSVGNVTIPQQSSKIIEYRAPHPLPTIPTLPNSKVEEKKEPKVLNLIQKEITFEGADF